MDLFGIFVAIIIVGIFSFGIGVGIGRSIENSSWQRIMIEDYGATYCDGIFSLTPCSK